MPTYLAASDVADICNVDLKTVHNWCEQDVDPLPHFRTPGRHLRFKPRLFVPWIKKFGYDVPAELQTIYEKDVLDNAAADAEAAKTVPAQAS